MDTTEEKLKQFAIKQRTLDKFGNNYKILVYESTQIQSNKNRCRWNNI